MAVMTLVWPSLDYLPGYVAALERGWTLDHLRGEVAAQEQLARIRTDTSGFLSSLIDRDALGSPLTLRFHRTVGHIGYGVVPWKQRRGYATRALREILRDVKAAGLRYVDIITRPENVASQRVIAANGGVVLEQFATPEAVGGHTEVRYRIRLQPTPNLGLRRPSPPMSC